MKSVFVHPTIGEVVGNKAEGCTQFLGVKYATLKHRLAPAEPVQYRGEGIDATKHGPQVVGPPSGVDMEHGFIQHELPKPEFPGVSDVDGLSLNITVPVFIHGGGFVLGGNWWPQYDLAKVVKLSTDLGKPLIAININYRVGAPGFLTSPELRAAGCQTNNGLRDQRAALRWIQEYIAGFGGDPNQVTVMGESAGAVSAGLLLLSKEPLAKQLILIGGSPPLMGQLPMPAADHIAKDVMLALGLDGVPSSDAAQRLLNIPVEDFWTKIPMSIPMIPVIDNDVVPTQVTLRTFSQGVPAMPGYDWVSSIMVGDSKLDASIMAYTSLLARKAGIAASFQASAAKTLQAHPDTLKSLLQHYSLDETATSTLTDDEALLNILKFISDVAFFMPAVEIASNFPKNSFIFGFNEPNPWDGLFKGHASHVLDVAFLFQNYNQFLDETQRASAVAFATDVITFTNSQQPWKPFNNGDNGAAFYSNGKRGFSEPSFTEQSGRSPFILEVGRDETGPGKDVLVQVFTDFITG
ncbi:related to carboxylesterase [Cephalotrichum gorgonifer]|uniref:Carboxylic ester hydrolase n=1 Tax=Cephalotrichum gorgonifer TaxID=2041049 RepID=A0AAE8T089_9PEZI|nr:related to carboxylesterase [Cephalotrichum gorgonifer]